MTKETKSTIVQAAKRQFSLNGYEGFTMRTLAKESGVGLSSIYHFFKDKDILLKYIFDQTNTQLGTQRALLPKRRSAQKMLHDRIVFQFTHIEDVVFVLKYYLHYRSDFLKLESGFLPSKAYLHIEEVLAYGRITREFIFANSVEEEAKVIAHAINGFLLEYYPNPPKGAELNRVTNSIFRFLMRALTNKEVIM